jgi:predicted ATPase
LSLAQTLFPASWVATWCGQFGAACKLAREGIEIAKHEGYPHVLAGCTFVLGWALGLQGKFEEGKALIRQGIGGWTLAMNLFQHVMLAEVYLKAGQPFDALESLTEFAQLARANGEHHGESEAQRLRAEALLIINRGNATVAEQHLREAIAISGQQGAKSMELRATAALARLLRNTGRANEARQMLAKIYEWFTEGFRHRRPQRRQGAPRRVEGLSKRNSVLADRAVFVCCRSVREGGRGVQDLRTLSSLRLCEKN